MNGHRAKQLRKLAGTSIASRRDRAFFERTIRQVIDRRTERRYVARRVSRYVLASLALFAIWCVVVLALMQDFQ